MVSMTWVLQKGPNWQPSALLECWLQVGPVASAEATVEARGSPPLPPRAPFQLPLPDTMEVT